MKKNSSNSTQNDLQIRDELKGLILSYMEACNAGDHAKAEGILHVIDKYNESHS